MPIPTTGLAEHYIAGTGETTTGSLLDSWVDQSGGGYAATGTTTQRPTVTTDAQGRPVVCFPYGSSCRLVTNGPAYNARAVTIWIVARLNTLSGAIAGINGYGGGSANMRIVGSNSVTPTLYAAGISSITIRPPMNLGIYGVVCGASATVFHDGTTSTSKSAVSADATNTGGIEIGAFLSASYCNMDVYEIAVYSAEQSPTDQADTKAYLAAKYGVPSSHPQKMAVFVGDSITAGVGSTDNQTWPFKLASDPDISSQWLLFNRSASGGTLTTETAYNASVDGFLSDPPTRKVLVNLIGRNDMTTSDAATFYSALVTYTSARVTAGWEVWDGTNIANTNGTVNGRIVTANGTRRTSLIADTGANRIIDFGADPLFDAQADSSNTTYYTDGTHLTNQGNVEMARIIRPNFITFNPGISTGFFFSR